MGLITKKKIFGADIAGRVESIDKDIQLFRIGDEVLGDLASNGFGGFAEYGLAPEKALVLNPVDMSFDLAAALPMAAKPNQKNLEFVTKLATDHIIKPVIDRYYTLDKVADAILYISEGHARRKVIIKLCKILRLQHHSTGSLNYLTILLLILS